mgnify:CR=1 FL=1
MDTQPPPKRVNLNDISYLHEMTAEEKKKHHKEDMARMKKQKVNDYLEKHKHFFH